MTASRMGGSVHSPRVDEFSVFVFFGGLVVIGIFLAIGKWYPGSGAEQVDWRPTRSPEVEAELELDDVDQMIEAQNARRRASGRREITEDDVRAQVAEDERWREELRRRARAARRRSAEDPPPAEAPPTATEVARVLIVGCGCRGRALGAALAATGTRCAAPPALAARLAGARGGGHRGGGCRSGPARHAHAAAAGVTVVCWLMGSAEDSPTCTARGWGRCMEHLVDTPVRGLVYEAAGSADAGAAGRGRRDRARGVTDLAHAGGDRRPDPADHEAWLEAMTAAVERLLSA